jgi:hypothetical protein
VADAHRCMTSCLVMTVEDTPVTAHPHAVLSLPIQLPVILPWRSTARR